MAKPSTKKVRYSGVLAKPIEFHSPKETYSADPFPDGIWRSVHRYVGRSTGHGGVNTTLDLIAQLSEQREASAKILEQFVERVVALFEHYDIAPGDFTNLALELASAHVPGFQIRFPEEKTRGRPTGVGTGKEFVNRVEQFREILPLADKLGLKRACKIVSARRGSRCYGVKPGTLRKRVTNAKRAQAGDLLEVVLILARFTVDDRGIVRTRLERDANAGTISRTGTDVSQGVRKK